MEIFEDVEFGTLKIGNIFYARGAAWKKTQKSAIMPPINAVQVDVSGNELGVTGWFDTTALVKVMKGM